MAPNPPLQNTEQLRKKVSKEKKKKKRKKKKRKLWYTFGLNEFECVSGCFDFYFRNDTSFILFPRIKGDKTGRRK
jgi:hypothetical protein